MYALNEICFHIKLIKDGNDEKRKRKKEHFILRYTSTQGNYCVKNNNIEIGKI